jgi:predicted acyl esterase
MPLRHLLALAAAAVAGSAALPAVSAAATPEPFGHACTPSNGVRLCATTTDDRRVPSFDGTSLDVDVLLPPTGDGPFPAIAILHGYGGDKTNGRADGVRFARQGYAVVLPSARGFGRSCGLAGSRTGPGCARGWQHLGDSRYEVRDVQHLLGRLVDEGVADPKGLGATGGSYGGGTSLQLGYLRDRVRLPDGRYARWRSPKGTALRIAAVHPVIPWSDLADSLVPNGYRPSSAKADPYGYARPYGVPIQAYVAGLYAAGNVRGWIAPLGADPGADLTRWKNLTDAGEPFTGPAGAALRELHRFHGASGIAISRRTPPAPMIIRQGWTDDLFPAWQGIRPYEQIRRLDRSLPVQLQLGDLGHARGANHPGDAALFDAQALALFDRYLKGKGRALKPGVVTAFGQSCPASARDGIGPWRAGTVARLARGRLALNGPRSGTTVSSAGGDAAVSAQLNPLFLDACKPLPAAEAAPGTLAVSRRTPRGFTLLGPGVVRARAAVKGSYPQLVVRLWDVDPRAGTRRLVDRSVTRLARSGRAALHLNGNGWRFAAGHEAVVEVLGRDAPAYRPSNTTFSVRLSQVRVTLPTRESRPR